MIWSMSKPYFLCVERETNNSRIHSFKIQALQALHNEEFGNGNTGVYAQKRSTRVRQGYARNKTRILYIKMHSFIGSIAYKKCISTETSTSQSIAYH